MRAIVGLVLSIVVGAACGGNGGGGNAADAGIPDAPPSLDGNFAAEGEVCGPGFSEQDAGEILPCEPGLVCCYPCGIPDCFDICMVPCAPESKSCVGGCPLVP